MLSPRQMGMIAHRLRSYARNERGDRKVAAFITSGKNQFDAAFGASAAVHCFSHALTASCHCTLLCGFSTQ